MDKFPRKSNNNYIGWCVKKLFKDDSYFIELINGYHFGLSYYGWLAACLLRRHFSRNVLKWFVLINKGFCICLFVYIYKKFLFRSYPVSIHQ